MSLKIGRDISDYLRKKVKSVSGSFRGPFIDNIPLTNKQEFYYAWFTSTDKRETIQQKIVKNFANGDVGKVVFVGDGFGRGGSDREVLKVKGLAVIKVKGPEQTEAILEMINKALNNSFFYSTPGGIDLSASKMNINDVLGGINFHLNAVMLQQLQNTPGFVPVIISVKPLIDLQRFLSLGS